MPTLTGVRPELEEYMLLGACGGGVAGDLQKMLGIFGQKALG